MMTMDTVPDYVPVPLEDTAPDAETPSEKLNKAQREGEAEGDDEQDEEPVSWAWIYLLCVANFGISGAWALEFAIATPFFEQGLKAGQVISHSVWIVGPLSGLLVAPVVGTLSDRCTSTYGRRRPFVLGGLVGTVVGMLSFSHARQIVGFFFAPGTKASHWAAIVVAVLAFCVLDVAINTTMWPGSFAALRILSPAADAKFNGYVRALQGDLVPHFQQHSLQSASVVMGSLGDLAANYLVHSFEEPVSRIRLCFLIASAFYVSTVLTLLVAGRETPVSPDHPDIQDAQKHSLSIVDYLRGLPSWMWRVGGTYALGFFMLFCVMPNASSWLGSTVLQGTFARLFRITAVDMGRDSPNRVITSMHILFALHTFRFMLLVSDTVGSPSAPKGSKEARLYEHGVRIYGRAGLLRALVQIVYSAIYPWLLRFFSAGQLLGTSFGVFSILLLVWSNTTSKVLAQVVVVMMALPMAAEFSIPVGLTVELSDASNRGRYLGALNCFAVIPQLIDTLYTGYVSKAFGEGAVIRIGGVWGILTAISAFFTMRM